MTRWLEVESISHRGHGLKVAGSNVIMGWIVSFSLSHYVRARNMIRVTVCKK
jgi:hypothetical protein